MGDEAAGDAESSDAAPTIRPPRPPGRREPSSGIVININSAALSRYTLQTPAKFVEFVPLFCLFFVIKTLVPGGSFN